jgi:hypothetical protein
MNVPRYWINGLSHGLGVGYSITLQWQDAQADKHCTFSVVLALCQTHISASLTGLTRQRENQRIACVIWYNLQMKIGNPIKRSTLSANERVDSLWVKGSVLVSMLTAPEKVCETSDVSYIVRLPFMQRTVSARSISKPNLLLPIRHTKWSVVRENMYST